MGQFLTRSSLGQFGPQVAQSPLSQFGNQVNMPANGQGGLSIDASQPPAAPQQPTGMTAPLLPFSREEFQALIGGGGGRGKMGGLFPNLPLFR